MDVVTYLRGHKRYDPTEAHLAHIPEIRQLSRCRQAPGIWHKNEANSVHRDEAAENGYGIIKLEQFRSFNSPCGPIDKSCWLIKENS